MSHYDFNSDNECRKNLEGDFQQPNTEESGLIFEENEVQFIPVDLHDDKTLFKYSGELSKPESEKYYSNAELRTIKKFNSLFNKVVVLPSNTFCGRTGTSFSNGDYGDASVKGECWKTKEKELVHYEGNSISDLNVGKADHYSSECHSSQRKKKTNEIILIEQDQHQNIEQDFLCKTVIFHKLKSSSYIKKYTSFLRVIYESNFFHSESCNLRMIETELTGKKELIIMDNMHRNSVKKVSSITTKHPVNQCNNCMYIYPISMSNNDGANGKLSSKTYYSKIPPKKKDPRRIMDVVQDKNTKIESYKTANSWNYGNPGGSSNGIKRDIKMTRRQKLGDFSDMDFSEVNFRKIFLTSPEQCTFIVKNLSVVETDLTRSNEILKLSYSTRLASALKRTCKSSSKPLVTSQVTEELSLKSKESMTMKRASILIIKKLFGKKHSGQPPCNCDNQDLTRQSEPTECVNKILHNSMQQRPSKRIEAKKITNETKRTERENKIQQLVKKLSVDNRCISEKYLDENRNSHATPLTAKPKNTMKGYKEKFRQPSTQDKIEREKRINELIQSMSTKYACTNKLNSTQQNALGKTISEQHDQYDKRKQREMRLQRLIEQMKRKQKCLCDPCDEKNIYTSFSEYKFTDFEMCECDSVTSKEKLSQETENFSGDRKNIPDKIGSNNLGEKISKKKSSSIEYSTDYEANELKTQKDHEDSSSAGTEFHRENEVSEKKTEEFSKNSDELCICDEFEDGVNIVKDEHIPIAGENLSETEDIVISQFLDERKTEYDSKIRTSSLIMDNGKRSTESSLQEKQNIQKGSPHISIAVKVVVENETISENEIPRDIPKLDGIVEKGEISDDNFQIKKKPKRHSSQEKDDSIIETTREEMIPTVSDISTENEKKSDEEDVMEKPKRHTTDKKIDKFSEAFDENLVIHQPERSTTEKKTDKFPESSDEEFAVEKPKRPTTEKKTDKLFVLTDDEFVIDKPENPMIEKKIDTFSEVSDEEPLTEKPERHAADGTIDNSFEPFDEEIEIEEQGGPRAEKKRDKSPEISYQELVKEEPRTHVIEKTEDNISETTDDIMSNDKDNVDKNEKTFDSKQKKYEFLVEQEIIRAGDSEHHFSQQRHEVEEIKSSPTEMEEKKIVQELSTPPGVEKKTIHSDQPEFGSSTSFSKKIDENGEKIEQLSLSHSDSEKIKISISSDLPDTLPDSSVPSKIENRKEQMRESSVLLDDNENIDLPAVLSGDTFPSKIEEKKGKSQRLSFLVSSEEFFEEIRSTDRSDSKSTLPKSREEDENVGAYEEKDANFVTPEKGAKMSDPAAGPQEKITKKYELKKKINEISIENISDETKYEDDTGETGPMKKKRKSDHEEKILPHNTDKGPNTHKRQPKHRSYSKTSRNKEPPETNKSFKPTKTKSDENSKTKKENITHIRRDSRNENFNRIRDPTTNRVRVSEIKPSGKLSRKSETISEKEQYNQDAEVDLKQKKTGKKSGIISSSIAKTKNNSRKRGKSSDQYSSNGEDLKHKEDTKKELIKSPDKFKRRRKSTEKYSPNRMISSHETDEDIMKTQYESKIRGKSSEKYSVNDVKLKHKDEKHRKQSDKSDERKKPSELYSLKNIKLKRHSTTVEDAMKSFDTPKRRRKLSEQYSPDRGDGEGEKLIQKPKHNLYEDRESDEKGRKKRYKRSTDYSERATKITRKKTDASKESKHEIIPKKEISSNKLDKTKRWGSIGNNSEFELKNVVEKNIRQSEDAIKIKLNSEYLEILEDVALSEALEMEEILKISFSPKHQTNLSITNPRGEKNIGLSDIPPPKTGKRSIKLYESKFIDSELEWSPSSLININILVDDKENQKCICRKKISSESIQNSNILSNVLSRKSADLSSTVKDRFVSACKRTCNKVKCKCIRPSNLYFSQKSTASNLRLKTISSKNEIQSANEVVFQKLPDARQFQQSHNMDAKPVTKHINDTESSGEPCKTCEKRGRLDAQKSPSVKHKCFKGEVKLESPKYDNIDFISFCGKTISPNDVGASKPCEKKGTVDALRNPSIKHKCFCKEVKLESRKSDNIDSISSCGNIISPNDMKPCEPCEKRGAVDAQRSASMKQKYFSREEGKLESSKSVNTDSISFCGNIISPNDMKRCKRCEKRTTTEAQRCAHIKHECFSGKEMDVEVCESKNIDSNPLRRNFNDLESSYNVETCKQCKKKKIFKAERGESTKHRYFCGKGVKIQPCESDNIDSITLCGTINNVQSFTDVKLCKPYEKTESAEAQMIHRPFPIKDVKVDTCRFNNGDSHPSCENINKCKFFNDVKTYKPCERRAIVEPLKTAIKHSCFPGQCAKLEICQSNNTDTISASIKANHFESTNETKLCRPCKKTVESQRALSTKYRCFSEKDEKFESCESENSQTCNETKTFKCNDMDKKTPKMKEGKMITKCKINQSNHQNSDNCDSSAEKLPLKSCPRIRLSNADQTACATENGIFSSKFMTPQISPLTAKVSATLQVSQVSINALDDEEATTKADSALLDEKLCRKLGSPDLTKSCTCTLFPPSCIPIYYANTKQISCFSFSQKGVRSNQETAPIKSLYEEIEMDNNSQQNVKDETQTKTGVSSNKTSLCRQSIDAEERIFTEVSGVFNRDTTVFNFIEILTQSEQKFMSDENKRQFANKREESEYSTFNSDLSEYHEKEIVDSFAENSASSSDIELRYLQNQKLGMKRIIPMSNKKSNKIINKQKIKKKKEFLNNYEKQRSIIMRKKRKTNNKQTTSSTLSSEKNVNKIRKVLSEYLDSSSTFDNYKFSNTNKCQFVLSTSKHTVNNEQISWEARTKSVLRKSTTLTSNVKDTFYSPYNTSPALYHVAVESVENIGPTESPNQKIKFRIAFFFKKSKGKIINWFKYLQTMKTNVNPNFTHNGKNEDEVDRALAARINLMKQKKVLISKLRQTDSQTSKLYLYNKLYQEKGPTELIISKSEKQPIPVLQEIKSDEIIVPALEDDLRDEESGGDQKDEERIAGPSLSSDESSVLFIKKEVYDRLQRYGKLHYTLYIGERNELDHISIESLDVSEEKIKCDDQPFFASFDLGTKDVLVHVTKDTIDRMEDEEVKEAIFKDEKYVACQNSQVRLSLMRGAKYLQKLDPTQANIIEIDCSNKLHEIKICYKKIEHSKTCICEYPQVCKNIQLESSDLSSIVIEKIDKILDAREVCENCERCKEKSEACVDYQECSDENCSLKKNDYAEKHFESQPDSELKRMYMTKHVGEVEYEDISIKSSECCDAVCSKKLAKNLDNEEEDNVKTIQFMQVTQRCGFQEEKGRTTISRESVSELQNEHKGGICVSEYDEKQKNLVQLNHISQKPDSIHTRDKQKNVNSKPGSKMQFRKNENQKSQVNKRKKMQKRTSPRCSNNHKPTLILTLTHFKSILNIPY